MTNRFRQILITFQKPVIFIIKERKIKMNKTKVGFNDCIYFNPDEYTCVIDGTETNEANSCPRGINKIDLGTY